MEKEKVLAAVKKPVTKVVRLAHITEAPVHLVYFFAIATHMDYATAALVCFIIGTICLIPAHKEGDGS